MRTIQGLIFVTVAFSIVGGIHYYLWTRLVRDTSLGSPWRTLATLLLILACLSIPATFFLGRTLPYALSRYIVFLPYVWMGSMFFLLTLLAAWDGVRLVAGIVHRLVDGGPPDLERRLLLARTGALLAVTVTGGMCAVSIRNGALKPVVKHVNVALAKLSPALSGFRIVQISDLHIGLTLGRSWLEAVVSEVNAQAPDLIAITGDLMDGSLDRLKEEVEPLLGLRARKGVFFVTGNHEYYSGIVQWTPVLESLGLQILRNERVTIEDAGASFELVGIDDFNSRGMAPGHGPNLPRALEGCPPDRETVLLAHQPRAVDEASRLDVGLVLAGHTHGGQIWPWHYLIQLQQPYRAGLHTHGARTQIYVSEGTGFWGPPMRLGTRGEVTLVELTGGRPGNR